MGKRVPVVRDYYHHWTRTPIHVSLSCFPPWRLSASKHLSMAVRYGPLMRGFPPSFECGVEMVYMQQDLFRHITTEAAFSE